ncbi:hypothetical protein YTPLAS18_15820 [Nitrospira sp.]|nr:hypothetical protein YTPLAS18_15820 [Nitrospira sp.]
MRTFRLATYNIHNGRGVDGRYDPARTAIAIKELGAQVVALQEVTTSSASGVSLLAHLAEATGLHPLPGPVMKRGEREYGNGLLTEFPVSHVTNVDLSLPGHEPRGAMDIEMTIDGSPFRLINTHLGLSPFERRAQGRRLLKLLGEAFLRPTALVGDLNGWFLTRGPWVEIRRKFGDRHHAPRTFPVFRPVAALDRIWVYPHSIRGVARVHVSPVARVASDHLPLVTNITLPPR